MCFSWPSDFWRVPALTTACPRSAWTRQAQARLLAYTWPGNIRELANVVERAALFAESSVITGAMLDPLQVEELPSAAPATRAIAPAVTPEEAMRQHLLAVLEQSEGNISQAAARLGIARNTLYARLEKFGVRGQRSSQPPQRPVRRPSQPGIASPAASTGTHTHWEQRGITLLRAALIEPEGVDAWSITSRALDVVIDKLQTFGGRIEELTPGGLLASFGIDPLDDAPRRAAQAALTIHKGAARAGDHTSRAPGIKIGIHVAQMLVGRSETSVDIDAEAKRAQWPVLGQLLQTIATGETVASADAAVFPGAAVRALVPIDVGDGRADRPYRLTGQERRGLGLWGAMTQFVGRHDEIEALGRRWPRRGVATASSWPWSGSPGWASRASSGSSRARRMSPAGSSLKRAPSPTARPPPISPRSTCSRPTAGLASAMTGASSAKRSPANSALDPAFEVALPAFLTLLDLPVDDPAWQALDPPRGGGGSSMGSGACCCGESQVQPLSSSFEDLHWIDAETQAFLDSLVERSAHGAGSCSS